MNDFYSVKLNKKSKIKTSWIYSLSKKTNIYPNLHLKYGTIHGFFLCKDKKLLVYVEDIVCHNTVDKIFYLPERLTSEIVLKTVIMGIPILISRSGFTEVRFKLEKDSGLVLIGIVKGKKFVIAN